MTLAFENIFKIQHQGQVTLIERIKHHNQKTPGVRCPTMSPSKQIFVLVLLSTKFQ